METLMKAAKDGGLDEKEVKEYLESGEDKFTIKNKIRMVDGDIDGVPYIVICGKSHIDKDLHLGRKRDFTVQGAVEEDKYIKTFIQVEKEFN
jgi:predicted DsbA family dithiol-disulfide isomerase